MGFGLEPDPPLGTITRTPLDPTQRLLIAANFGTTPLKLSPLPDLARRATLVTSTDPNRASGEADLEEVLLLAREAIVLVVQPIDNGAARD